MPAKSALPPPLPPDAPSRLSLVGQAVFGANYRSPLAKALGMGRTKLWELMSGRGKRVDLNGDLIELLNIESDANVERGLAISALRRRFLAERESR